MRRAPRRRLVGSRHSFREPIEEPSHASAWRQQAPVVLSSRDGAVTRKHRERIDAEHPADVTRRDLVPRGAVHDEPHTTLEGERRERLTGAGRRAERQHVEREHFEHAVGQRQTGSRVASSARGSCTITTSHPVAAASTTRGTRSAGTSSAASARGASTIEKPASCRQATSATWGHVISPPTGRAR